MNLQTKYDIGELVFLRTDSDQLERMVTCIKICATGCIYTLAHGTTETYHYEMELCRERNQFKALGIN